MNLAKKNESEVNSQYEENISFMKHTVSGKKNQKYEHIFLYFLMIYTVKRRLNVKYISLYFVILSQTTFLIHQFKKVTDVTLKNS